MSFEDLFVRFWWLIFPLFGMIWAFVEMTQSGQRSKQAMDVIKSLVEQGKDPPSELLDIAAGDRSDNSSRWDRAQTPAAAVVVNTALAIGFGLASRFANNSNTQEVFFVLAAVFGVIALGFFFIAMFGPRPK